MRTYKIFGFFIVYILWYNRVYLKPLPDLESSSNGCVHSEQKSNLVRVARSIPDMDAVNPAYLEGSQMDQEESADPSSDVSPLVLADQVSSLFRSHKSKAAQKYPVKQVFGERAVNVAREEDSVQGGALPLDEQEECYNQQNIDPPGSSDYPHRFLSSLRGRNKPIMDVAQSQHTRPLLYKDKGRKRFEDRSDGSNELTSLYSDPEKIGKGKKGKSINSRTRSQNAINTIKDRRVYKPVGVQAEFPVYDADIDFQPDPLQGILDDKYWLDSQEQEAVIRKYIDLASNMQPPGAEYVKRDAATGEHLPKSIDSREAFRDAERECPCKNIAACGDCSRGRWRKKNNTGDADDGVSFYGNYVNRKLLGVESPEENLDGERDLLFIENDGDHAQNINNSMDYKVQESDILKEDSNSYENSLSKNYVSNGEFSERDDDESQIDGDIPTFTSRYFGRKLLVFEDDETTEEEEDEDDTNALEYESTESSKSDKSQYSYYEENESFYEHENEADKKQNRRSIVFDDRIPHKHIMQRDKQNIGNITIPIKVKPHGSGNYEYTHRTRLVEDEGQQINGDRSNGDKFTKNFSDDEFIDIQSPFLKRHQQLSKYYVPNKLGNLLQKPLMKQKYNDKTTTEDINVSREIEVAINDTSVTPPTDVQDLTTTVTTETNNSDKHHNKRGEEIISLAKGRRSYQVPLIKHPHAKSLQDSDDSSQSIVKDIKDTNKANATSSGNTVQANSLENTTQSLNSTAVDANSTVTDTTVNTTTDPLAEATATTENKKEEYDEDQFDAEIANDIVETVIAESQSGSVMGHNLGLCRRNESTMSRYARVSPETERLLKMVTTCILDRIRDHLEKQSCSVLEDNLLQFLKWMVLSGESYKDYMGRINPHFGEFGSHSITSDPDPEGLGPGGLTPGNLSPGGLGVGVSGAIKSSTCIPAASAKNLSSGQIICNKDAKFVAPPV